MGLLNLEQPVSFHAPDGFSINIDQYCSLDLAQPPQKLGILSTKGRCYTTAEGVPFLLQ